MCICEVHAVDVWTPVSSACTQDVPARNADPHHLTESCSRFFYPYTELRLEVVVSSWPCSPCQSEAPASTHRSISPKPKPSMDPVLPMRQAEVGRENQTEVQVASRCVIAVPVLSARSATRKRHFQGPTASQCCRPNLILSLNPHRTTSASRKKSAPFVVDPEFLNLVSSSSKWYGCVSFYLPSRKPVHTDHSITQLDSRRRPPQSLC